MLGRIVGVVLIASKYVIEIKNNFNRCLSSPASPEILSQQKKSFVIPQSLVS